MASGPTGIHHGSDLTSSEITVLPSVGRGVSIQRSDTEFQKTSQTYGRTRVEDEVMEELPVILKLGGTLCNKVEKAP